MIIFNSTFHCNLHLFDFEKIFVCVYFTKVMYAQPVIVAKKCCCCLTCTVDSCVNEFRLLSLPGTLGVEWHSSRGSHTVHAAMRGRVGTCL